VTKLEPVGDKPSHLHSLGALERVNPFLTSVLFDRLRRGACLVWGTDLEWIARCCAGFRVLLWKRLYFCFTPEVPFC